MPLRSRKSSKKHHIPLLLQDCQRLYNTTDLYKVIGACRDSTAREVKSAYYKTSLKVHPDRVAVERKDAATRNFQTLGKVYIVLSDTERRKLYDETGYVEDEENIVDQDRDWSEYWRVLFPRITTAKIREFERKYKGSEEELEDLKAAYIDAVGDMSTILDSVMCATIEDEQRFAGILEELVQSEQLPAYTAFKAESEVKKSDRRKKARREGKEAEAYAKLLNLDQGSSVDDLTKLVLQKQTSRRAEADSFFAHLEAKYAQPKKGRKQ